jgi:hypothetical protein
MEVDLYWRTRTIADAQAVWARTIPPAETGYIAKLDFHADKKGGDAAQDCVVDEAHGAKPMWKALDEAEPAHPISERGDQLYVRYEALAFIGVDNHSVGGFRSGEDDKHVYFEVFFREKKSIQISLACKWRNAARTNRLQDDPHTNWLQGELNEPVNTAPRVFRVRGWPMLMEFGPFQ